MPLIQCILRWEKSMPPSNGSLSWHKKIKFEKPSKQFNDTCPMRPLPTIINLQFQIHSRWGYCNPSPGFSTKARACKRMNQMWSLGVTFHAPRSVGECEGMNPHISKWVPTLGIGIPTNSWIFKRWLQESKLIGLKNFIHHWKILET